MDNIKHSIKGTILTVTIDLAAEGKPSTSGKSEVIASTRGNLELPGGFRLGLNLYKSI